MVGWSARIAVPFGRGKGARTLSFRGASSFPGSGLHRAARTRCRRLPEIGIPLTRTLSLVLGLCLVAVTDPAISAGGAALHERRLCHTCHGRKGADPALPQYPRLAGQNAAYSYQQMRDIRDGRRTNGLAAAMRATVAEVPDEELRAIAEWRERL